MTKTTLVLRDGTTQEFAYKELNGMYVDGPPSVEIDGIVVVIRNDRKDVNGWETIRVPLDTVASITTRPD